MPVTDYPIFQPAKRKKIYPEFYFMFLILITAIPFIWIQFFQKISKLSYCLITLLFVISFIPLIAILVLNHYKIDFKKGKFIGSLILNKNYILINNQTILIDKIKSVHFINHDFFIRYQRSKWIGPKISCGVDNVCIINTIEGEKYQFNFFQSHDNELVKAENILKHYYLKNILSLKELNKILLGTN